MKHLMLVAALFIGCADPHQAYSGWAKLHPDSKVTYEEWEAMRTLGVLPGVQRSPTPDLDLATGIAIGSTLASPRQITGRGR